MSSYVCNIPTIITNLVGMWVIGAMPIAQEDYPYINKFSVYVP